MAECGKISADRFLLVNERANCCQLFPDGGELLNFLEEKWQFWGRTL